MRSSGVLRDFRNSMSRNTGSSAATSAYRNTSGNGSGEVDRHNKGLLLSPSSSGRGLWTSAVQALLKDACSNFYFNTFDLQVAVAGCSWAAWLVG